MFDIGGGYKVAIHFADPGPREVDEARGRVDRLRRDNERRATRRARTPWRRDRAPMPLPAAATPGRAGVVAMAAAMTAATKRVYEVGVDALDVVKDQRERVRPATRPITDALLQDEGNGGGGGRRHKLAHLHVSRHAAPARGPLGRSCNNGGSNAAIAGANR